MSIKNMEKEKPYIRRENYFKTIAISTIVFQSFILTVPKHITNELEKIEGFFSVEKLYS